MRLTSLLLGVAFAFSNFQANANLATPAHTKSSKNRSTFDL